MQFKILFYSLLFLSVFTMSAQEANGPKFGDGILNVVGKDSTWATKMGMHLQFQGLAQWDNDAQFKNMESSFLIRRARLKFDGFIYSPRLTYTMVLGLSNRDMAGASSYTSHAPRYILDALIKWNFYKNLSLWFGQTKLPENRENLTSSSSLQFVGRSLLTSSFASDRDLGIQLRHHFKLTDKFVVKESFALSQGEGRNVTSGNLGGYQYTARLELLPFGDFLNNGAYVGGDLYREQKPKLAFGTAFDFNDNAVRTRGNQGAYMLTDTGFYETDMTTVFLDMMFKYQGFSFMAEFADRKAQETLAKNADGTLTGGEVQEGQGWNLQSGYLFKNNWELSGRYSHVDLSAHNTGRILQNQYTLGISKFLVGHKLKIQSDISYLTHERSNDRLLWRLQFNVHF